MSGGVTHVANKVDMQTEGKQSEGSTAAQLPVIIGGVDKDGKVRTARVGSGVTTEDANAIVVKGLPLIGWRDEFDGTALDTVNNWDVIATGAGQTVAVEGSSLIVKSGVTTNSETIIRSKAKYSGATMLRFMLMASQRIVNAEAIVELVDVPSAVVAGSTYLKSYSTTATGTTVSGAPTITGFNFNDPLKGAYVTGTGIPSQTYIKDYSGSAGNWTLTLSQNCTASASVTITMNGTKITGSNTLKYLQWIELMTCTTLADFNYTTGGAHLLVTYAQADYFTVVSASTSANGATGTISWRPVTNNALVWAFDNASATTARMIAYENGYSYYGRVGVGNSQTGITSSTTAAPGAIFGIRQINNLVSFFDSAPISTSAAYTNRATRESNIPNLDIEFYIQIRIKNVAVPASETYWFLDFLHLESPNEMSVRMPNAGMSAPKEAIPMSVKESVSLTVAGANAHDSATLGNPVMQGQKGVNALVTAVANNDTVSIICDLRGRQLVYGAQVREMSDINTLTLTSSTTETTLIASVASTLMDITDIMISNKSATGTVVEIRDSTTGTVRLSPYIGPGITWSHQFNQPLKQATAANNWTAKCLTSVDSVYITTNSVRS